MIHSEEGGSNDSGRTGSIPPLPPLSKAVFPINEIENTFQKKIYFFPLGFF